MAGARESARATDGEPSARGTGAGVALAAGLSGARARGLAAIVSIRSSVNLDRAKPGSKRDANRGCRAADGARARWMS